MNMSYKENTDFHTVLAWIQQFPYPNCKKVTNLASLRNGVAIAEVLVDKLPQNMQPLFLPHIEIYNINPQRSIMNLKVLLSTLQTYFSGKEQFEAMIEEFNAEGLYFDHNMMETFIYTILMNLQNASSDSPPNQLRQGYLAVEEISDLANLSSIIVHNEPKQQRQIIKKHSPPKNQPQQDEKETVQMLRIKKWLLETHHIEANELQPDQIIGKLMNSIFAGSRLEHNLIVKQSHYQLGSLAVFKKVCDHLLSCERMPKQNVLTLVEEVEEGSIREEVFWSVIEDLMNLKVSHNLKTNQTSRKKSISKTQQQSNSNKQNIPKQTGNTAKQGVKVKPRVVTPEYTPQTISNVENWIKNELGYEYSLNKSKTADKIQQNPLLNGALVGSVIMRMQIGKVNTIKQPKDKKQIQKNITQVVNCLIRRGIESARKFACLKPTYQNYMGIIWDIKCQYERRSELERLKIMEKNKQKKEIDRQVSQTQKESLKEWLKQRGVELENYPYLPAAKISEFCGEILELRLLRQTTQRIKQINMTKILQELRRVGWQSDCSCQQVLEKQGNNIRWSMLKFTRELLRYRVYYYR